MGKPRCVHFFFVAIVVVVLSACSSEPHARPTQKSVAAPDKIQGKIQVLAQGFGSADASLSDGRPVVYLWQGVRRYTLYFRKPVDVVHGNEYVAEGVHAQRVIDEIGDPDMGRNGYPLLASCERVVRMAWSGLALDELDGRASVLRARVKRYPARPVFLVTELRPVTSSERTASADREAGADDDNIPEVSMAAEKQQASLIAGPTVLTAPLWEPSGGTVRCQVVIDAEGKVSKLSTGMQLCEAVPWSQFRYRPQVRAGHPVKVKTEVEVCFKPLN